MTTPTTPMNADDVLAVIDHLEFIDDGRCPRCGGWVGDRAKPHYDGCGLVKARTAVAAVYDERDALLSRVAELETDAARWQHARTLLTIDDIENGQAALEAFGAPVSEQESKRADEAIDAARSKGDAS